MSASAVQLAIIAGVPMASFVVGEAAGWRIRLGAHTRSRLQHFAAGAVIAAIGSDLLPIIRHGATLAVGIGLLAGATLSIGLSNIGRETEHRQTPTAVNVALVATAALDVLFDGLLLGIGGARHAELGLPVGVALGIENIPLGIALAAHVHDRRAPRQWKLPLLVVLGAQLPVGCSIGVLIGNRLGRAEFIGLVACAVAALLFLATEELLVEAHQHAQRRFEGSLLFLGFWVVLLLDRFG